MASKVINYSDTKELYDQLFFPFTSRFFKPNYSFENEAQGPLKEKLLTIQRLFGIQDSSSNTSGTLDTSEYASEESTIKDLEKNSPGNSSEKKLTEVLNPKEDALHDLESFSDSRQRSDSITAKLQQLLEVDPESKSSVEEWLYFHRMLLLSIKSGSVEAKFIMDWIQNWIRDKTTSIPHSVWWFAERVVYDYLSNNNFNNNFNGKPEVLRIFLGTVELIKYILRVEDKIVDVIYYTSLKTLSFIFPKEKKDGNVFFPKILSASIMNDPEEGQVLQRYLSDDNGRLRRKYWWNGADQEKSESRYCFSEPFVFCKSFTNLERRDDLSMWEIYGDRAEGCCCRVEITNSKDNSYLYNIAYLDKGGDQVSDDQYHVVQIGGEKDTSSLVIGLLDYCLGKIKRCIQQEQRSLEYMYEYRTGIMEIAYLFKDSSYSHENEIRYLHALNETSQESLQKNVKDNGLELIGGSDDTGGLPLLSIPSKIPFRYKEVILGPKVKKADVAAAYFEFQFKIHAPVGSVPRIIRSDIHYR